MKLKRVRCGTDDDYVSSFVNPLKPRKRKWRESVTTFNGVREGEERNVFRL
jgi:hypothetical protein